MVRFAVSTLLTLLPALALAGPPAWEIDHLSAVDAPLDASQTDVLPNSHQLSFDTTDLQQDLKYTCSVFWTNQALPQNTKCFAAPGNTNTNTTINFSIFDYFSASDFDITLTEFKTVADVVNEFQASFGEKEGQDGGQCTRTPLNNNPSINFASCTWAPFFVQSNED